MTTSLALPQDVRRTRPGDAAAIAAVLAAAFTEDPVFRWLVPDEEARPVAVRRYFDLVVEVLAPHEDTWTTADGVLGAALWVPYGREPMSEEAAGWLGARAAELFAPHGERLEQMVQAAELVHPAEPHEYLWFLGVAPSAQGRGIGGRLLAPVLGRADRAGHPAYLEATSPRNRGLYERYGFVAAEPIAVPGGPPLWPMWRPAS